MDPGNRLDGAEALLTRLGHYFHHEDAAAKLLAVWQGRMDTVRRDAARWQEQPHPRVLMMHFGQEGNTYLALGDGGPAEQVIKWSGGENAILKIGGMTRLTPEMIAQAAPEVIIATDVGFDRYGSADKFAELPGVGLTPAGKSRRIYRVDETDLMYFGPRTPDAVARITAFIHT
jgi:iron complex transport system substrate-binding protein